MLSTIKEITAFSGFFLQTKWFYFYNKIYTHLFVKF